MILEFVLKFLPLHRERKIHKLQNNFLNFLLKIGLPFVAQLLSS